ncbi:MAG: exosortase C-terminal domain/associated protein EpsI [Armatimonadota bacterium]
MVKRPPNYCLVLIILVISTAITYWAHSRPPVSLAKANLDSLPVSIGKWHTDGPDGDPGKDVLSGWLVSRENFLMRDYVDDNGDRVSLMLVFKGHDRRSWHLSEMCFSGSGYNVTQTRTTIPYAGENASAVKLFAEDANTGSKVISVYWLAQGKHAEANFAKQQLTMALARLHPSNEGWAFIRVTSDVLESEEETMKQIRSFIRSASDPLLHALASDNINAEEPISRGN